EQVNWAGPRRPAWEVFFGFRQIFCNAVRILRMEKVETLVVTVPMASPKNPPGSEKCLEARRRLQAPGGEVASLNRTRLSGDINRLRRRGGFRLFELTSPKVGRQHADHHESDLTCPKSDQPRESAVHETVGVQPDAEHVDSKP